MERVKTCVAKVGQPDLHLGMRTCGQPVTWFNKGETVDGEPTPYTGYRHVYSGITDHGAVPEGWA